MPLKETFGGMNANPVSDLFRKKKGPVFNLFFIGSGSRALVYQRALVPGKYISRAKAASCGVMFGRFTKETIDWADVVIFQRVSGSTMENLIQYCRLTGTATIFDIDDDVFNYPEAKEYEETDTGRVAEEARRIMNLVDVVVVTEEEIKESAKEYTIVPIHIIPNYMDLEVWDAPKSKNYIQPDFLIGWAGGHYHSEDLKILEEPMRRILTKYPEVKFVTIGDKIDSLIEEFGDRAVYHEFVDIADFPDLLYKLKFSIGLAPLSHSEFSNSRSNLRLLQYALLEIPTISSYFGPYKRAFDDNFPIVSIENDADSWVSAISILIENDKEREFLGKAAREATKQKYRAALVVPKWMNCVRLARELSRRKQELQKSKEDTNE